MSKVSSKIKNIPVARWVPLDQADSIEKAGKVLTAHGIDLSETQRTELRKSIEIYFRDEWRTDPENKDYTLAEAKALLVGLEKNSEDLFEYLTEASRSQEVGLLLQRHGKLTRSSLREAAKKIDSIKGKVRKTIAVLEGKKGVSKPGPVNDLIDMFLTVYEAAGKKLGLSRFPDTSPRHGQPTGPLFRAVKEFLTALGIAFPTDEALFSCIRRRIQKLRKF